jgi:hypothetical protein
MSAITRVYAETAAQEKWMGSALSGHTPTAIIPTIMVVISREAVIWSLGEF